MRGLFLAGWCLAAGLAAAGPARADLQPGSYEMTTTVMVPGVTEPQTATQTQCIKPQDARDPGGHMLKEMSADGQCTVGSHSQEGDHLVADFICNMQGHRTNGRLDVSFAGSAIDGSIVMKMQADGQGPQEVTTRIKAVRRGDCS